MIVYHPIYDSYHCLIRLLKILRTLPGNKHELDRIRIYDYYLLFINEIGKITLPHEFSEYKSIVLSNKYNSVQNIKHTFLQLKNVQEISFKAMAAYGFIDKDALENDIVFFTYPEISIELTHHQTDVEVKYFELVTKYFEIIPLKELKRRTKLMDYRYELA